MIAGVLGSVALAWLIPGGILWLAQERLLFPRPTGVDGAWLDMVGKGLGADPVRVVAGDGTALYGWFRRGGGRGAALYLHGNGETLAHRVELHGWLASRGLDVLVVAYRGYPGSDKVTPSERGLVLDARAAWDWLIEAGYPADRILVYGKSLGGGVAAALAEQVGPGALVLESTFLSIGEAASDLFPIYPTRLLVRHKFDTRSRAAALSGPALVLHGDADRLINVRHGRALGRLLPAASYVEIAGAAHDESFAAQYPAAAAAVDALLDGAFGPRDADRA